MAASNDITGDKIQTRPADDKYRKGWDRIFGSKDPKLQTKEPNNESDSTVSDIQDR